MTDQSPSRSNRPADIPQDVWDSASSAMNNPFEQTVAWEGPLIVSIARAILAERDRCAKIAGPIGPHDSEWSDYEKQAFDLRTVIADAIRGAA